MKQNKLKNKLLQALYTPYKKPLNISYIVKKLDEVEKELENK